MASAILRKRNKVGGITIPNIKLYYKATVIKKMWYWNNNRHRSMEQNREPRNKPWWINIWWINILDGELIFDKGCRSIKWDENGVGRTGIVLEKYETWPPTYTVHQNKLKIDKRLTHQLWQHKSPRGKQRQ